MPRSLGLKPHAVAAGAVIPTVSLWHSLVYNMAHVLPAYLRGLFTPNRFWTGVWDRLQPDPAAVKFVGRLRNRYHSDYLYLRVLTRKTLLVLDPDGIKQVLDQSPEIYADAKLKRKGMGHFQPHALTISRGQAWRDRRRFNEAVLDSDRALHRCAAPFLDVIRDEVRAVVRGEQLTWEDFARLFDHITLQLVFGKGVRDGAPLKALRQLMRESNRGFALKKSQLFSAFYAQLRQRREGATEPSLAAQCRHAPVTEITQPDHQMPHWLFAMADTLAINSARALALITAHPDVEARLQQALRNASLDSADAIDGLDYLEGCIQEAMRLWPTTPMLVRESLRQDRLGGATLAAGTQVLILNSFNHRDPHGVADADGFTPERWMQRDAPDYRFNHLSNGPQVCAGKNLALFISKSVLAQLLVRRQFELQAPRLDPDKPLPYCYNHFRLRFGVKAISDHGRAGAGDSSPGR